MSNDYTARLKTLGEEMLSKICKNKYKDKIEKDCEKVGLLMVSPVTEKLNEMKKKITQYKNKNSTQKVEFIKDFFEQIFAQNAKDDEKIMIASKTYLVSKNITKEQIDDILKNKTKTDEILQKIDDLKLEQNNDKLKALWRLFRIFESSDNNYNIDPELNNLVFDLIKRILFDEKLVVNIQNGGELLALIGLIVLCVVVGSLMIKSRIENKKKVKEDVENAWRKENEKNNTNSPLSAYASAYPSVPPTTQTQTPAPKPLTPVSIPIPQSIQNSSVQESPVQQSTFQESPVQQSPVQQSTFQQSPVKEYPYQAF
jgi:hypothetical protein